MWKKTLRGSVFTDVGKERSDAKEPTVDEKSLFHSIKKHTPGILPECAFFAFMILKSIKAKAGK